MPGMPSRRPLAAIAIAAALFILPVPARAELEECRLLRQPDIQGDRIVVRLRRRSLDRPAARAASPCGSRPTRGSSDSRSSRPTARPIAFTGGVRRQRRRLHRGRGRRRAEAPDVAPRRRSGRGVVPRRQVDPAPLAARVGDPAVHALLPRSGGRADSRSCSRFPSAGYASLLRRRLADRVRLPLLRQPDVEALQGRERAGDLGLRLREEHAPRRSPTGKDPTSGRCGTAARSTTRPIAAAAPPTSGPTTRTRRRTGR